MNLKELKNVYEEYRGQALCLDIECTRWNGPISVIGLYRPAEGEIEAISLVKGRDLTPENVKEAFKGCRLMIHFNGLSFDVPKLKKDFPGCLPDVPQLDLYKVAVKLNLNTNLKVLESMFHIERLDEKTNRRRIATRLWRKYEKFNDEKALQLLIEYNRQDTINLYPLAEALMRKV